MLIKYVTLFYANHRQLLGGDCKKRPFLGNDLVNMFPRQQIRMQQQGYCWERDVSMWSVPRGYQ
jgi:hypothetical protein